MARQVRCRWECGGRTRNRSGICDGCWSKRVQIRAESMAEKRGREPDSKRVKAGKEARRARMAILEQQLAATELSEAEGG